MTKLTHVNPNCKNSSYCKPHGEVGLVEYDWDRLNANLK